MINKDSVFRRLPPGLERRQVLFIDGIRYCAEMAGMAYGRLAATLTKMALDAQTLPEARGAEGRMRLIPLAFLDAWATVDAIYRFRGLVKLYPHQRQGHVDLPGYREMMESVAGVRNVADHLAQKMTHVEAHAGAALGVLSWLTFSSADRFYICMVYPGTPARTSVGVDVPPGGTALEGPTDFIQLSAGEHKVNLSSALKLFRQRIAQIEGDLATQLRDAGVDHLSEGSDLFVQMTYDTQRTAATDSEERAG